jgi:hypothetical protein
MNEHEQIIQKYYERGFRLLFYQSKQKGPSGAEAAGWPSRNDTIEDYKKWINRGEVPNVGVFTGHEISPGKFLADIDFDWADGLPLAGLILPATGFGFGRTSRTTSHAFFTTPEPIPSMVFDGIDGKPIVELRGTKQDGSAGLQTMLPPSIHPNGEQLILRLDEEIGHSDDLPRRVALYATACILFANFSNRDFGHEARLATAGFLLMEGLAESEVILVGSAIAHASGNNVGDFKLATKTTAARFKKGEKVVGRGGLTKLLGAEVGKKIISKIKEWLGSSDFIEDSKGKIIPNHQENVKAGLSQIGCILSFDNFSQKPMVKYTPTDYEGPLNDSIVNKAWLEIDSRFHFRPSRDFFNAVVDNLADTNRYHPVLDYLNTLTWDGEPRIDTWLIQAGNAGDTEYSRAVSRIMLLAAVKRITTPGCKYDEMVVLESAQQGLFKSSALRALCPNDKWFSDDLPLNVDSKQVVEKTLGKWIIEASDLSGMSSSQVEHLKGMLSRQIDGPVRLAYTRIPIEQPRQFIIVGTTNSYSYLTDSTGNRRFWPIRINGRFNVDWILENRDQLWAEAYHRIKEGASIRLDPSLYEIAAFQQERRRSEDPWETKLDSVFERDKQWRLTPDQVWAPLGVSIDRQDTRQNARVLKIMETLGFRRLSVRTEDGKVVKGFGRDAEEPKFNLEQEMQ